MNQLAKLIGLALAAVVVVTVSAYGQDTRIGVDVTPKAQVEENKENDKREAERIRRAEIADEQWRQNEAKLRQARERAQTDLEAARIRARGEAEAAKERKPDVCLLCDWRR